MSLFLVSLGLNDFVVLVGLQARHGLRFAMGPSDLNADRRGSRFAAQAKNHAVVVRGENTRPTGYPAHQLRPPKRTVSLEPIASRLL